MLSSSGILRVDKSGAAGFQMGPLAEFFEVFLLWGERDRIGLLDNY